MAKRSGESRRTGDELKAGGNSHGGMFALELALANAPLLFRNDMLVSGALIESLGCLTKTTERSRVAAEQDEFEQLSEQSRGRTKMRADGRQTILNHATYIAGQIKQRRRSGEIDGSQRRCDRITVDCFVRLHGFVRKRQLRQRIGIHSRERPATLGPSQTKERKWASYRVTL